MLNFSEACERNKQPILAVLQAVFSDRHAVLEIGSGSGQHALFFAERLPHLRWQPSEPDAGLGALRRNLSAGRPDNLAEPIALDAGAPAWSVPVSDAVFTANTLHIIAWEQVEGLLAGVGRLLAAGGHLAVYGPFRYGGRHTSPSNAQFDRWLKRRDPRSGIRDFEAVDRLAARVGLALQNDYAMPANNRLLVWRRVTSETNV